MATIARRAKKAADDLQPVPKYEMIIFSKTNCISTSHLVLYDQESVSIACSIFKDLCRFVLIRFFQNLFIPIAPVSSRFLVGL